MQDFGGRLVGFIAQLVDDSLSGVGRRRLPDLSVDGHQHGVQSADQRRGDTLRLGQ
jgi:hypothetical protein